MINDEYGFDLNSAQARDNLNYEIQSGIRRKKNFNAIEKVEKRSQRYQSLHEKEATYRVDCKFVWC